MFVGVSLGNLTRCVSVAAVTVLISMSGSNVQAQSIQKCNQQYKCQSISAGEEKLTCRIERDICKWKATDEDNWKHQARTKIKQYDQTFNANWSGTRP